MSVSASHLEKITDRFRKASRAALAFVLATTLMMPVGAWGEEGAVASEKEKPTATPSIPEGAAPADDQNGDESGKADEVDAGEELAGEAIGGAPDAQLPSEVDGTHEPAPDGNGARTVFTEASDTSWYDAALTTLTISTPHQLAGLAMLVNAGNDFESKTVTLGSDLNLSDFANWIPIGTGNTKEDSKTTFRGVFDGAGHTVSGLSVSGGSNLGLFGSIATRDANVPRATLKNITLESPKVSGATYVGGLVGSTFRADIENVHVTEDVAVSGNKYVGGLVGHGYVIIKNSSVKGTGSVTGTYAGKGLEGYSIGGLIGFTGEQNAPTVTLSGCSVEGITVSAAARAGGLMGYQHRGVDVENCTVSGVTVECNLNSNPEGYSVDNATAGIGGLVGVSNGEEVAEAPPGALRNCTVTNTKLLPGTTAPSAGYLYGKLRTDSLQPIIENCFAIGCTGSTIAADPEANRGSDGSVACASITKGDAPVYYGSLQAALNASTEGDTVSLLGDVTENVIVEKAGITIDGQNHAIDGKGGNAITVKTQGAFTVKNLTINATEGKQGCAIVMPADFGPRLTVENCLMNVSARGISFADNGVHGNGVSLFVEGSKIYNSRADIDNNKVVIDSNARGIALFDVNGAVSVVDSQIKGFGYGINVSGSVKSEGVPADLSGLRVSLEDSQMVNWGCLNVWGSNASYSFANCTLLGVNSASEGSNAFATIILNDDLYGTKQGNHAKNITMYFENTTVMNEVRGSLSEDLFRIDNVETAVNSLEFGPNVKFINTSQQVTSALYFTKGTPEQWKSFERSGKVKGADSVDAKTVIDGEEAVLDVFPTANVKNTFLSNGNEQEGYGSFAGYLQGVDYEGAAASQEKLTLLGDVTYPYAVDETNGNAFGGWILDLDGHALNVKSWNGDKVIAADSSRSKTGYIKEADGTIWKPSNANPSRFVKIAVEVVAGGNTQSYETIAEAVQAVSTTQDQNIVIRLMNDVSASASLKIPEGKSVTVEGNKKTITGANSLTSGNELPNSLFVVSGNLTLKNVNVKNVGIGVRMIGDGSCVEVRDGSNIEAQYYALALRNVNQQLTVSDSVLAGWAGIMTSAGDVVVKDNTEASIAVTGSTINCKPISDELYGAITLQQGFNGVKMLIEKTSINILNIPKATKQAPVFDIRAYGSTIVAQEVTVKYDEAVAATNAVFILRQREGYTGTPEKSTITFSGSIEAPQATNTVAFNSGVASDEPIRRIEGDVVSINGFAYAPDANGIGHRLFTDDDVSVDGLTYTGASLAPSVIVQAGEGESRIRLVAGIDYDVTYQYGSVEIAADAIKNVGTYYAVVKGKGDYREVVASKQFMVTPKPLAATDFKAVERTYRASAYAASDFVTLATPASGITYKVAAKEGSDLLSVGEQVVIATGTSNYSGTIEIAASIAKASDNKVTVQDASVNYDGKAHGLASAAYAKEGSTLHYSTDGGSTWSETAPSFKNAGSYAVHVKATNPNYEDTPAVQGAVVIAPAAVVVEVADATKVYGSSDPAFAGKVTGLVEGEQLSVSYQRAKGDEDKQNVGDKIVLTASYVANGNYAVAVKDALLSIAPKPLAGIDFKAVPQTYQAKAYEARELVGLAKADSNITFTAAAKEGSDLRNAGAQSVIVTGTGNYGGAVTIASTISQKEASIAVDAATKVRGNADPVFTGKLEGFIEGDDPRAAYQRTSESAGKETVGADIDITATCGNANYKVAVAPAKLTIVKAAAWVANEGKTVYFASIPEALGAANDGAVLTIAHGTYDLAWNGAACLTVAKSITVQGEAASKVTLRPAAAAPQSASVLAVANGAAVTLKNIAFAAAPSAGGTSAAHAVSVAGGAQLGASLCTFDTGDAVSLATGAKATLAKNYWGEAGPSVETYGDAVYPYYKESAMTTLVYQTQEKTEADVVGGAIDDLANKPGGVTKEEAASVVESLANASQSTRDEMAGKSEQLAKIEEAYAQTEGVTKATPDDAKTGEEVKTGSTTVTGAALSAPPSTDPDVENAAKLVVASVDIPAADLPAGVKSEDVIPLDITLNIVAVNKASGGKETLLASGAQPVAPITITMTVKNKWGSDFSKVTVAHYHNDEVSFIRPSVVRPSADNAELTLTFTLTKLSSLALVAMDEHKIAVDETNLVFGELVEGYGQAPAAKTVTVTNTGTNKVTLEQPQSTDAFEVGALSATELAANGATATFTVRPKTGLAGGAAQAVHAYNANIPVAVAEDANVKADIAASFSVKGKPEAPEVLGVQAYRGVFDGTAHAAVEITDGKLEGDTYAYSTDGGATFSAEVPVVRDAGVYAVVVRALNAQYADRVIMLEGDNAAAVAAADATKLAIDPIGDQAYIGSPVTPEPVVRLGNTVLIVGRDYTVSYANNVDPGMATAVVAGTDGGNLTGSREAGFSIVKASEPVKPGPDQAGDNGGLSKPSGTQGAGAAPKLLSTGDNLAARAAVWGGLALLAALAATFAIICARRRRR